MVLLLVMEAFGILDGIVLLEHDHEEVQNVLQIPSMCCPILEEVSRTLEGLSVDFAWWYFLPRELFWHWKAVYFVGWGTRFLDALVRCIEGLANVWEGAL